jgi:hypothetical protein
MNTSYSKELSTAISDFSIGVVSSDQTARLSGSRKWSIFGERLPGFRTTAMTSL